MSVEARRLQRLASVLSGLGMQPVEVIPIGDAAAWSRSPRSFRVATANHGWVKVRMTRGAHRAARASELATQLADPRVPAPLGWIGSTTVERWVDGVELASTDLAGEWVDAAADLLGAIHQFPGANAADRLPRCRSATPLTARAGRHIAELADAGRLGRSEQRRLAEIVGDALPARSRWGLVHNDFCASNLIVGEDGGLFSIDNEHMARGFLEYDLGRAWYRWPMSEPDERRFLGRYRSAQGADPPPEEQRAWRAIATLKGAHLRHRRGARNDDALSALRRLLES